MPTANSQQRWCDMPMPNARASADLSSERYDGIVLIAQPAKIELDIHIEVQYRSKWTQVELQYRLF